MPSRSSSRQADAQRLLEAVESLLPIAGLDAFARTALTATASLVPAESYTFNLIGPGRNAVRAWSFPEMDDFDRLRDAFAAHRLDHPVLRQHLHDPDGRVATLRDLTTLRQFRQTGLYAECYRHLRYHDHLAFCLASGPGTLAAIALGRLTPFTTREKNLLERFRRLLAPLWTLMDRSWPMTLPDLPPLTLREREILHWVSQGKTNAEIAIILTISPNTVKNHLARILEKLGVETRTAAAHMFFHLSLLHNPEH